MSQITDPSAGNLTLRGNTGGYVPYFNDNFDILGAGLISTVGNPLTGTITINASASIASTYTCDTGLATPAVNILQILGGVGVSTSGATNIVTINIAKGTNGQLLVGAGATSNAVWATLGSSNGVTTSIGAGTLSVSGVNAAETTIGVMALATDLEAIAGTVSTKAIVPTSLKAKLGTQTLHGLPIGAANTAAITWTAEPSNGQLLIGKTGDFPVLATITSGNNITATGGAGSISIAVTGTTEHAVQLGTAAGGLFSMAVGANGETIMGSTGANCSWTNSPQFGGSVTALYDISSTSGNLVALAGDLYACNHANDATAANISFRKARTAAIIQTGDALGQLRYTGYDGVGYITGAKISSTNSGTPGVNRIAGDLKFFTHPDSIIALPSEPLQRMSIAPTGEVSISTPDSGIGLSVLGNGISVYSSTVDNIAQDVDFKKSRSGAVITTGDELGNITFQGHDGVKYVLGAAIIADTNGTIAVDRIPTNLTFWTHPDSINVAAQRVTIASTGEVTIAAPDSGTALKVTGTNQATTFLTDVAAYNLSIAGKTITAGGSDVDVGIILSPKGASRVTMGSTTYPVAVTKGDVVVATADNTLNTTAGATTAGYVLMANGATTYPTFQAIPVSGIVTLVGDDSGTATGSSVTIAGGTNIGTTATGSTVTVNLDNSITLSGDVTALNLKTSTVATNLTLNGNTITSAGTGADIDINLVAKGVGGLTFDGIATGYSDSQWHLRQSELQTTNATPTALVTIPLVEGEMISIWSTINGFQNDFTDACGATCSMTCYRPTGGNVTQVGEEIINVNSTSIAVISADVNVGTQSMIIYATGVTGETWNWVSTHQYMFTKTNA